VRARAQTPINFQVVTSPACVGETVRVLLTNAVDPTQPVGLPGDSLYWRFGSAASTPRTRTSASVSEMGVSYVSDGTFSFTIELRRQGRLMVAWWGPIVIQPGPAVRLGPDTTVCGPVAVRLAPRTALPPGSTLSWPDSSTGPSFLATAPGTYWLEVKSPGMLCSSRVPRVIKAGTNCGASGPGGTGGPGGAGGPGSANWPAPGNIPNIITADGDGHNDYFVLDGLVPAEWRVQVFNRWGRLVFEQAAYDNGWSAPGLPAGLYYYLLRHAPSGQRRRGWVEVLK
jgi:hypothetical protein